MLFSTYLRQYVLPVRLGRYRLCLLSRRLVRVSKHILTEQASEQLLCILNHVTCGRCDIVLLQSLALLTPLGLYIVLLAIPVVALEASLNANNQTDMKFHIQISLRLPLCTLSTFRAMLSPRLSQDEHVIFLHLRLLRDRPGHW